MLSGLLVNGLIFPFLLGVAVTLVLAIAAKFGTVSGCLLTGLAVVATYIALEGIPSFPPGAVKQKLGYAFLASAILASVVTLLPRPRWHMLVGLAVSFALACLFWFAGPVLARATDFGVVFAPLAYTALASMAVCGMLIAKSAADGAVHPRSLVRLSAVVSYCIGSAVVAAIGGFIGMGQMFGALAALTGGILLVGYIAALRGSSTFLALLDGVVPALLLPALATGIVVAFFATSLDVVAHMLLPLTLIFGIVLARSSRLDRLPSSVSPLVQGGAVALPALIPITVSVLP